MAKISELSNEQLLKSIEKYQKLLKGLRQERVRRVNADPSLKKTLFTEKELSEQQSETSPTATTAEVEQSVSNGSSSESFQLSFKDSEIDQIEKMTATETKNHRNEEKDNVGMTQVLKLSAKQLEEFNKKGKEGNEPDKSKKNKK